MQLAANSERARYNKLGKPIGGTFIFAGIILMLFGACCQLALKDLAKTYRRLLSLLHCPVQSSQRDVRAC